jgi:hypothetical protein
MPEAQRKIIISDAITGGGQGLAALFEAAL